MELLERFRSRYPFPLDDFQVEAIRAIDAGQSVIVSAPTGAGKTLVAEFAIHAGPRRRPAPRLHHAAEGALEPEVRRLHPRASAPRRVGILTGDVKVNPRGRVLVMTTEILRNMFYTGGLDELGYVVLDECHYMGDEGRGTVWEEIIVNAPPDVQLVAPLGHRGQRQGDRRLDLDRAPARSCRSTIPIGPCRCPTRSRTSPARSTTSTGCGPGARAWWATSRAAPTTAGRWYTRRVVDPDAAHRGAGGARLAADHLLHLQPRRLRARDGRRADRGRRPAGARRSSARSTSAIGEALAREPDRRRVGAQPERVPRRCAWASGSITPASCRASSG